MANVGRGDEIARGFLIAAYVALGAFGLLLAFGGGIPAMKSLIDALVGPFFGGGVPDGGSSRLLCFVFGVMGAMMLSWSALMIIIAAGPLRRGEGWAWKALLAAALIWFVPDESFSIYYGVTVNAIGNVVLLAWILVPLAVVSRRHRPA